MSFNKIIKATVAGTNSGPYTIYHTSEVVGNIVASGVTRVDLLAGVNVTIPDGATLIIVRSDGPCGNAASVTVSQHEAPDEQAHDIVFSNTEDTSTDISWTNGDGSARVVFIKQALTGSPTLTNGTTYTPNTVFGSGSNVSGWYCIYNGTGSTVSITGLLPSTQYRVMVLEYNGPAGSEVYNMNTATINPSNVITDPDVYETSTLTFSSYQSSISLAAGFTFTLSNPLTESLVITSATVNGYAGGSCSGSVLDQDDIGGSKNPLAVATILAGNTQGGYGASSDPMETATVGSYKFGASITIDGYGTFTDGQTFVAGGTTVTVSIPNTCNIYS
jgi:hypothetical protein